MPSHLGLGASKDDAAKKLVGRCTPLAAAAEVEAKCGDGRAGHVRDAAEQAG